MDKIKKIKVLLGMVKQEFETAKLVDGSEISFDSLEINREVYNAEGEPLKEGEYTLEDGTIIVVDVNGVIKEIRKADGETEKEEVVEEMAEEVVTEEVKEEEVVEPVEVTTEKSVEDRVAELEAKVDEIYNLLLQISDREREREEKIEEVKEEFATIKSNPSAQPVFVQMTADDKPLSRIEKLKRLKNQ